MSKVHDIKDDEKALKQLEMQLKEQTETVKKFDERVLELLATDSEEEEDAFAREIEESGALREKVNFALITIDETFKANVGNETVRLRRSDSENSILSVESHVSSVSSFRKVRAKLPKLELKGSLESHKTGKNFGTILLAQCIRMKNSLKLINLLI